jgi:excinuclease UvrABC nuclease subunit
MSKGNRQSVGYVGKSKQAQRKSTSIFQSNSRRNMPAEAQTIDYAQRMNETDSRFGQNNSKSMHRLTSAKIYCDQMEKGERFNEEP